MSRLISVIIRAVPCVSLAFVAAAPPVQPKAGEPLPGLTGQQRFQFLEGLEYYRTPLTAAQGLGPAFNQPSCVACHEVPVGGWGSTSVTRFGRQVDGQFDFLESLGGPVLQRQAISSSCLESVPGVANHVRTRVTPSVLAFGLVEAIDDATLIALEDPNDADGDGISGRAHRVHLLEDPSGPIRIGRFGWKSQIASILSFSADAARNEMGLTNPVIPQETAPNGNAATLAQCDQVPEIEDQPDENGRTFIESVTAFQRYLAPPPQAPRGGMAGEAIFAQVGCAKCHVPSLVTSSSPSVEAILRSKTIRAYSDFLLHDMGSLADGIPDGEALGTEMRTPPLWNLRTRPVMLHDGSASQSSFATRVVAAIASHAGEGFASRNAFLSLPQGQKDQVIAFLDSLGREDYDVDGNGLIDTADYVAVLDAFDDTDVSPDEPWAVADLNQNRRIDEDEVEQLRSIVGLPADCNQNGVLDWREIALGSASDATANGLPDECEVPVCSQRAIRIDGAGGTILDFPGSALSRQVNIATLGTVESVRVTLRMRHTWLQDVRVQLQRGSDAPVTVQRLCGGFDDVDGAYVFTDSSWIGAGVLGTICEAPRIDRGGSNEETRFLVQPGTYRPSNIGSPASFTALRNKPMNTTWTLSIVDERPNDAGELLGWSIEIRYTPLTQSDCNDDDVPDCQQLSAASDCDGDGVLDACQLPGADCDGDGVLDRCQIASESVSDCDGDGVPDSCEVDTDSDGVPDSCDGCPTTFGVVFPGPCGCGSVGGDADSDGVPDCSDGCPADPLKTAPGACGCGVEDDDSDGDSVLDCFDGCPTDEFKTAPGACGCGVPDTDTDGDGVANCVDGCPTDEFKTAPGACGCGVPDTDTDGDSVPDCIDDAVASARVVVTFTPSTPVTAGGFGASVDSDGSTVVIGAPRERVAQLNVAGTVTVATRDAQGRWLAPAQLTASSPEAGAQFGFGVAVAGDFIAVGAPFDDLGPSQDVGVVQVFRRVEGAWALDAVIAAPDAQAGDQFGTSVALADGRLFVGVPGDDVSGALNCGSVRVFEKSGAVWSQTALLRPTDSAAGDAFGCSVSASGTGLVVGAQADDAGGSIDRGSAFAFRRISGATWAQEAKLEPSAAGSGDIGFGSRVHFRNGWAIVAAGSFDSGALVDAGKAFLFSTDGTSWTSRGALVAPDQASADGFGTMVALDAEARTAVVAVPGDDVQGVPDGGSCRVFRREGFTWSQSATISMPQPVTGEGFGSSLAWIGDVALIGSDASVSGGISAAGRLNGFDVTPLDCNGDGIPDPDNDGDGIADCSDGDDDNDGVPDLTDGCPGDPLKSTPGQCGCGLPETDSDLDGFPDCVDGCPNDRAKIAPGVCGCGQSDGDSDKDGIPDCIDSSSIELAAFDGIGSDGGSQIGWWMAIDGDSALAGAPQFTVAGQSARGTVYALRRTTSGRWMVESELAPPVSEPGLRFGARLAIAGDLAVVTAPGAAAGRGTALVYRRQPSGAWAVLQQLVPSDAVPGDGYGNSVAISASGTIAVGASRDVIGASVGRGAVFVFPKVGVSAWGSPIRILASDGAAGDSFGHSVAISGSLLVVGAPDDRVTLAAQGSMYVFREVEPEVWVQQGKSVSPTPAAGAQFGREVAIDGRFIGVTSPGDVKAFVTELAVGTDVPSPLQGLVAPAIEPFAFFGSNVAVSGDRIAVGAIGDDVGARSAVGSVRLFRRSSAGEWSYDGRITAANGATGDKFGWGLAFDGDVVAVGAPGVDVGTFADTGRVSLHDLTPLDCDDDGTNDVDSDGDGIADCNDLDDDDDETPDQTDLCPRDPLKTSPGTCGCGVVDSASDGDGDGIADCVDNCPAVANASQSDCDGDGQGNACESQVDCNQNGVIDVCDVASGGVSTDFDGNGVPDECDPNTLRVPSQFATIQGAIDAAQPGAVILVGPGVYIGSVNPRGKPVRIHAPAGPLATILDGASVPTSVVVFETGEGPDTVLSGFTIRRGTQGTPVSPGSPFRVGGGIYVSRCSPTIRNCRVSQSRAEFGAGIYLLDSSSVVEDCTIVSNAAIEYGGGLLAFRGSVTIRRCDISDNVCGIKGGGIHAAGGSLRLESCTLRDNVSLGEAGGLSWDSFGYTAPVSPIAVTGSLFEDNFAVFEGGGALIWSFEGDTVPATVDSTRFCGNVPDELAGPISKSADTVICGDCNGNGIPDFDDITANPSLDCNVNGRIDACEVSTGAAFDRNGNGVPDECETAVLFVPSEYPTISAAIAAAQAGNTVWLSAGTFAETINPLGKAITISGSGSVGTVIDGTTLNDSLLLVKSGEGPSTVIRNITFRNGRVGSTLIGNPTLRVGGGAYIESASPTLVGCRFEQCRAQFGGGGYFFGFKGLIENCTFVGNNALQDGGGLELFNVAGDTSPVLRACTFDANVAGRNGGGLHLVGTLAAGYELEDCTIEDNEVLTGFGGGISWFRYGDITPGTQPLRIVGSDLQRNRALLAGGGIAVLVPGVNAVAAASFICNNFPDEVAGAVDLLDGAEICSNCPGDFDGDGTVSGIDLGVLLGGWDAVDSVADLNGDGAVNGLDLGILLGSWGDCG